MAADPSLENQRIKIALNALRVADYPGGGTHCVLFDFYARNQVPGGAEDLHFNAMNVSYFCFRLPVTSGGKS